MGSCWVLLEYDGPPEPGSSLIKINRALWSHRSRLDVDQHKAVAFASYPPAGPKCKLSHAAKYGTLRKLTYTYRLSQANSCLQSELNIYACLTGIIDNRKGLAEPSNKAGRIECIG